MKMTALTFALIALRIFGTGQNLNNPKENQPNATPAASNASGTEHITFEEFEWNDTDWNDLEFPIDPKHVTVPDDFQSISTKEEAIKLGEAFGGSNFFCIM